MIPLLTILMMFGEKDILLKTPIQEMKYQLLVKSDPMTLLMGVKEKATRFTLLKEMM